MFTLVDRLLIYSLITIGFLLLPATFYAAGAETGPQQVTVRVAGEEVKTFPLDENVSLYEIPVGGTRRSLLEIREGKARVFDANCPRRLCVARGEISKPGESIVCVPHRVVVTISGRASPGLDAVMR